MAETIKIGGELESTATGNVVAAASAIKDKVKNKYQNEINDDVARHENEIHGTGGIDSRLTDVEQMEQIVIDGGDAQIATGADFTNPDATKRAKVPTVGAILDGLNDGVYDVSKRNPTAGPNSDGKFTLDYILDNADTLIPTSWRHGGMTISFVDSSDNKYIQFRCKTQSFSTNPEDWAFEGDDTIVDDPNYIVVWTDSKNRMLLWLRTSDGGIDWAVGIPKPVKDYVDAKVAEIWNGNEETQIDGLNEVINFLDDFTSSEKLKQYLNETYGEYVEDINHIEIELDAKNRVLGGRTSDGKKFETVGFETPNISIDGTDIKMIDDSLKRIDLGLDKKGRIIHYRGKDGILHENVGIISKRLILSPSGLEEFKESLNISSNIRSSPSFIQFSDPHCDARRTARENGVNNEERMGLLVSTINNTIKSEGNIDFIICTGDLSIGAYVDGVRDDNLTPFKNLVADNINPKTIFLPVVGNHDPYTEEEWYNILGFHKQFSVELSSCFVIVLNVYNGSAEWSYRPSDPNADTKGFVTGEYMEENHLSGSRDNRFTAIDNDFLEGCLKKAKAIGKEAIVALHTLSPDSATSEDEEAAQASVTRCISLLNEYGCRLILNGHSHIISNIKVGEQYRCNPGWFGPINDYTYNTSPWAINVFKQDSGYFKVYNDIIAHDYVDTPRLGNVPASSTPLNLWVDNIGRANYKFI